MRRAIFVLSALLASALAPVARAEHTVGNPGNTFDLIFKLACERAAALTLEFRGNETLPARHAVAQFILDNRRALAADMLRCDLRFTDYAKPVDLAGAPRSCALTNVSTAEYPEGGGTIDTVYLSRPTCTAQGADEASSVKIMIHETVHHFVDAQRSNRPDGRISDETFCNDVAAEIYREWLIHRDESPHRWKPQPTLLDAPERRAQHTAIWTQATGNAVSDKKMLIWGGCSPSSDSVVACGKYFNDGGLFDPATNKWTATPADGAPAARTLHTSVWTTNSSDVAVRNKMIVWGGCNGGEACSQSLNDGGILDLSNTATPWQPLTIDAATPEPRVYHSAVWANDRMIVWGGEKNFKSTVPGARLEALKDGAAYFPGTANWKTIRADGAPSARIEHTAIWTGKYMMVWGGCDMHGVQYMYCAEAKGDGARYDPANDVWLPMSSDNAPSPRHRHTAVWTGKEMIVWGGQNRQVFEKTGGIYDPETDTWHEMSYIAPTARALHTAVWADTKMIVWGGSYLLQAVNQYPTDFGEYIPDPDHNGNDTWNVLDLPGHPDVAKELTSVWTGDRVIVWGGNNYQDAYFDRGGSYFTTRE